MNERFSALNEMLVFCEKTFQQALIQLLVACQVWPPLNKWKFAG